MCPNTCIIIEPGTVFNYQMGIATRIEEGLENIVESPFQCKRVLDSASIEIALKRLTDKHRTNILGALFVPTCYAVVVDESIYGEYEPFFDTFKKQVVHRLSAWFNEKGYETVEEINIEFMKGLLDKNKFDVFFSPKGKDDSHSCHNKAGECSTALIPTGKSHNGLSLKGNLTFDKLAHNGYRSKNEGDKESPAISQYNAQLTDQRTGEVHKIMSHDVTLGRDEGCHIMIHDETVSMKHLRVHIIHGKCSVEDCGSKNGTWVNHKRIDRIFLRSGDKIVIGNTELLFTIHEG
ncbi:MAG: hypothetical protein C0392_04075 [Syntrophus sp. (in: bacteria)]|nr:hypothetical protein [Syntrophus sp. (in: bacteria)]